MKALAHPLSRSFAPPSHSPNPTSAGVAGLRPHGPGHMEEIARNVAMAREYALCNNYETASIMMQSMVVELSQYIRGCQASPRCALAVSREVPG